MAPKCGLQGPQGLNRYFQSNVEPKDLQNFNVILHWVFEVVKFILNGSDRDQSRIHTLV